MSGNLKVRKVPLRKCVATNEQHPKMEMFRIVRTLENEVVIDLKGKVRGHGAYLSKKKSAIMLAKRKKILNHHLEIEVPDYIFDELLKLINEGK